MTQRFSVGEALGAPFALLRRRPLSVFAWGALRLLILAALFAAFAPMLAHLPIGEMARGDFQGSMLELARFEAGVQVLNLLQCLFGLMVFTAVMRATNATRGDGFAYLRLGMDELRVAVVAIVLIIAVYLIIMVAALVGGGLGLGVWSLGKPWNILILVVYGIAAFIGLIWLYGRVVLIIPTSLILKEFAFDDGWQLGRRQAWRIVLTGFLATLILLASEIIFVLIMAALAFGVTAAMGLHWPSLVQVETPEAFGDVIGTFAAPAAILFIPAALFLGFAQAMFAAPLAHIAERLLDQAGPSAPGSGGSRPGRPQRGRPGQPVTAPFPDLADPVPVPPPVATEVEPEVASSHLPTEATDQGPVGSEEDAETVSAPPSDHSPHPEDHALDDLHADDRPHSVKDGDAH